MHNKIYCSTGTIIGHENNFDFSIVIDNYQKIHADGLELMMLRAYYNKFNRIIFQSDRYAGLSFPVLHLDKDIGTLISRNNSGDVEEAIKKFTRNCRFAEGLGAKKAVLHLWGGYDSDANIDFNIEICGELIKIAQKYHQILLIENIPCTYSDPFTHWRKLEERYGDDIKFILDTRFLSFHGQTETFFELSVGEWLNNGKICHMHVSDYGGPPMDFTSLRPILQPCDGIIDFDSLMPKLLENYHESITLESPVIAEDGSLDIDYLNKSLDYINKFTN